MKAYADEYDLDEEQRSILYNSLKLVDLWFLKEMEKRANRKSSDAGSKSKRGHGGGKQKVLPLGERR